MIFRALVVIRDNANDVSSSPYFCHCFHPFEVAGRKHLYLPLLSVRSSAQLLSTDTWFATAAVAIASIEPRASSEKDHEVLFLQQSTLSLSEHQIRQSYQFMLDSRPLLQA